MTDYKATPEQWAQCEDWVRSSVVGASDACILELRARVEALEAAAHKHIVETSKNILALASRIEALESAKRQSSKVLDLSDLPQWTPEQAQQIADLLAPNSSAPLTSSNYPAKPDGSLVERIADAINSEAGSCFATIEARAAIHEVAAWLREQKGDVGLFNAGLVLDKEAEQ
jgi:hypothetical protein